MEKELKIPFLIRKKTVLLIVTLISVIALPLTVASFALGMSIAVMWIFTDMINA